MDVGELTFQLTENVLNYLSFKQDDFDSEGVRYQDFADVTAALFQTMFAIQHRLVEFYEGDKQHINGDLSLFKKIRDGMYQRIWARPSKFVSRGA